MSRFSRKRIAPIESASDIIEIRPSRYLRIQHYNARPRDEQFSREMGIFMRYKKTGIPASGPFTRSKRFTNNLSYQSPKSPPSSSSHPVTTGEGNACTVDPKANNKILHKEDLSTNDLVKADQPIPDEDIVSSYVNPSVSSSVLSSPSHGNNISDKIQSASSVLVALHAQQQQSQSEHQKSVAETLPGDLKSNDPLFQKTSHKHSLPHEDGHKKSTSDVKNSSSITLEQHSEHMSKHSNELNGLDLSKTPSKDGNFQESSDIVLFFIHGVGGSSDVWYEQIHYFAQKGYEVVAPDLIGHGLSCCPKTAKAYHFKEIAADIEEVFDRYCKKQNVVIGHSYGGSFATLLARTRSRRISKLVLISSGPPTPLAPQPGVFTLPTCLLGCIKPCLVCGFKRGAFHKKRKTAIAKENAFSIPTNVLQHMMNGQDWPDGDELYHNWLTCQCLLIYGADDSLVSLQDELDTQRAIFNSHLEVVKDASHMVMMEAPIEVNELLANFIVQTNSFQNQEHQNSNIPESAVLTSSFKRQKSLISLKSHVKSSRGTGTHCQNESDD